jgi:hypothetical protein
MEKLHPIERDLYGKIVQIKKERLEQVTRCTASQTVKSTYCGFQSRSGPERYDKFRDLIMIEPADCWLAAQTGRFKLNRKDYPFVINVRRLVIVNLEGGLDNNGNCKVGLFEVNRVRLKSQVASAMYEISGQGTYVWDYSQNACPDTLVSLYRGRIKVVTNSTATFTDSMVIVSGRDKNKRQGRRIGAEGDHDTVRANSADDAHQEHCCVLPPHEADRGEVASRKFNMVTTEAEFTRLESELSFLQVRSTMTLQEMIRQVKAEICEDRKQIAYMRL